MDGGRSAGSSRKRVGGGDTGSVWLGPAAGLTSSSMLLSHRKRVQGNEEMSPFGALFSALCAGLESLETKY